MKCANCKSKKHSVLDSRDTTENRIRRRRGCKCGFRWTTYEAESPDTNDYRKFIKRIAAEA